MKTENFYGQAQYQAPGMKMVKLSPRGHFLQQISNPGDRWIEGGGGTYGDNETIDNGEY